MTYVTNDRTGASLDDATIAELVALFRAHVDGVYTVAFRIVWNRADADDVTQITFLKAIQHLDTLRDPSLARPWLYRIAYREAIAVLRRRRETPVDPTELPERVDPATPETVAEAHHLAAAIDEAMATLPVLLRAAFVLRDVEELSMAEVAETLGIGNSAAKMRVHRARDQLRVRLQEVLHDV